MTIGGSGVCEKHQAEEVNRTALHQAVLLLGPTGSGKTPLGDALQREGFGGRRCHHFDFGEQLRHATGVGDGLDAADIAFVRKVLEEGALLEN